MSLAAIGNGAAYEFRWRSWAMLRDVLVANLDEASLPAFTSIGDALVAGTLVEATALLAELERIRAWLAGKGLDELVLGPRTSAVLHGGVMPTMRRRLTATEIERIRPTGGSTDLADYFATMLDSLAAVCMKPRADGMIEIVDG